MYFVYMLASKPYGTLYIGVTNGLIRRVDEHRAGTASKFTAKFKGTRWFGTASLATSQKRSSARKP